MVRDTLGEDAVIVATREEKGGTVHVTAAMEPGFHAGRFTNNDDDDDFRGGRDHVAMELGGGGKRAASSDSWLQYDDEDEEAAVAEEITEAMLRHSVPEDILDHIISCATVIGLDNPGMALNAAIEHLFSFIPMPSKPSKKAIMMVGQPGSGKTMATAKLAARGAMMGMNVGVITCDTVRAGGVEQLQAFTNLLQVPLKKVSDEKELAAALKEMETMDQVFIDSQGVNPFDTNDIRYLAKLKSAGAIDPVLVMPTGGDSDESGETARVFKTLGVNKLMPARLDIARRIGGLLSAAYQGKMAFTDAGNAPKVADGLIQITPERLSRILMPEAYKNKTNAKGIQNKRGTQKG